MYDLLRFLALTWLGLGIPTALFLIGPGLGRLGLGPIKFSPPFRVFILPSAVLLWPLILRSLLLGRRSR